MKPFYALIASGTALLIPAAVAQDASQTAPANPPEEKKICRRVTPTGSVMSKRICLTAAEWKQLNGEYDRQSAALRDNQGRSGATPR